MSFVLDDHYSGKIALETLRSILFQKTGYAVRISNFTMKDENNICQQLPNNHHTSIFVIYKSLININHLVPDKIAKLNILYRRLVE